MLNRLTFGHKNAPAHFQKMMINVFCEPHDVVIVYHNDIVLFGDDPDKLWEVAVRVIRKLTTAGFILNTLNIDFLVTKVKMLGFFVG